MSAAIPRESQGILKEFLPADTPWGVDLRIERINSSVMQDEPCSLGPRGVMAVTAVDARRRLRPIGRSLNGVVILHPEFSDLDTAAGLALLGHEMTHQRQIQNIPGFAMKYSAENRRTDRNRPWENSFELEAYMKERDVFCALTQRGFPPGDWVPLGVQEFGCPA